MARSKKKHAVTGITCAETEKEDKRRARRKLRRINRVLAATATDVEDVPQKLLREVSNVWMFDKDGKRWYFPGDDCYDKAKRK